jgi:hypothetical protein
VVNRYDAFGRAPFQMRRCSWSDADSFGVERMTVALLSKDKGQRIVVTVMNLRSGWRGPPSNDRLREYLMMLLGRIEPSRDFKRGLQAR